MSKIEDIPEVSLFNIEVEKSDFENGSTISRTAKKSIIKEKQLDLIVFFTSTLPLLKDARLSNNAKLVLSEILYKWVEAENRVTLGTLLINYLVTELILSRSSIYAAIGVLKKKKVLVQDKEGQIGAKIKDAWYLNPYIFGTEKWGSIEKLKFDFTVEFDFIAYESFSKVIRIAEYTK